VTPTRQAETSDTNDRYGEHREGLGKAIVSRELLVLGQGGDRANCQWCHQTEHGQPKSRALMGLERHRTN